MKRWTALLVLLAALLYVAPQAGAQAVYTATRKTRIQVGAGALYLKNDYTERANEGVTVWGDYDFSKYIGLELEGHFGGIRVPDDINENSYLVGPRLSYRRGRLNIFGKVMVGRGTISTQYTSQPNSSASYNMFAGGGGLEYRASRSFNIRVADIEMQNWYAFKPHSLSPLAVSAGLFYVFH